MSKYWVFALIVIVGLGAGYAWYSPSAPMISYKKIKDGAGYQVKLYFDSQEELVAHSYLKCEISKGDAGREALSSNEIGMIASSIKKGVGHNSYVADVSFDANGGAFSEVVTRKNLIKQLGSMNTFPCRLVEVSYFGRNPVSKPMQVPVKDLLLAIQF
ncbi:hypothetical protein [Chromobacterium violaceum]|uniref:hypothetical protein n=1 Tax=Chromobacterium violaceum TaxID=536 RepID=UPI00111C4985|nr:hypothetical protein [Chromobacterium violaceum]